MLLALLLACPVRTSERCLSTPCAPVETAETALDTQDSDKPVDHVAELVGKGRTFQSIQEAIVEADEGDVVLVQPGTHYENIDFHGKGIHVVSAEGAAVTVIDGQRRGSVVQIRAMEPDTAALEGFTLTNGRGTENHGGGLFVENADPLILHNVVVGNEANIGGGIYLRHGYAQVSNNVVVDNQAFEGGGGVVCTNCKGLISFNTFVNNQSKDGPLGEWYFEAQGDFIGNLAVLPEGSDYALRFMAPQGYTFRVEHNLLAPELPWVDPDHPDAKFFPVDVGTSFDPPVFTDPQGLDFTLLPGGGVDQGPPDALDVDGTRADAGAFGGPLGGWTP